jgi:hypothetical protein
MGESSIESGSEKLASAFEDRASDGCAQPLDQRHPIICTAHGFLTINWLPVLFRGYSEATLLDGELRLVCAFEIPLL